MKRPRHLLGLEEISAAEITQMLDLAASFKQISERPIKKVPTLRGKTVVTLFFEDSTRTRASFELAAKRLSADTIHLGASGSSASKGETLLDTARNLAAMRPDVVVVRHRSSGAPHLLARHLDVSVVNAGDGQHEHPTQGLLDMMTIREHKGRLEGLVVTLLGDVRHSRVARSNIFGLLKMGARVRVAAPRTLLPTEIGRLGVEVFDRVEPALEGADVVMALRIQRERQDESYFPSLREYARRFGLSAERLSRAKGDAIVLHPGPMNRGVEISPDVADGRLSVILDQVTNGLALRMALLYLCAGGAEA
jgi:aspartate carbamoyltransferase catalytic subunit